MKKLLILLIAGALVFTACEKEQQEVTDILTDDTQVEASAEMDGESDMDSEEEDGEMMDGEDADMEGEDADTEMDGEKDMEGDHDGDMMDGEGEMDDKDAMMDADASVGVFTPYTEDAIANADGKVVLAFFADWCPSCQAAKKDLNANGDTLPAGVTILDVNYDDATALKEKYNVTGQHTYVQIDSAGELLKKWRGGEKVGEIVAQIQ